MSLSQFFTHTLIVAIGFLALGFVGHQLLLGHDYVVVEPIMRSQADMQAHIPFALINAISFASGFVWLYSRMRNSTAWILHGLEFGVAVWLVRSVTLYLTNYVIQPWPGVFIAKTLTWELVSIMALGALIAAVSKRERC